MNEMLENDSGIRINMLGAFTLEYGGKIMFEDDGKIHKVWSLLGYLLANHRRMIGAQELQDLLCGDERSNNPAGVVKNLAYRLRGALAASGLPSENYIAQHGGVYRWNDGLNYSIDTEEFVALCSEAKKILMMIRKQSFI